MTERTRLSSEDVGRKLRELRKSNKLTLQDLEERVGIHRTVLSRMERGHYRVTVDTLFRIIECFGIETQFPFWEEVGSSGLGVETPVDAAEEQALVESYRRLTPEDRHRVQGMIDGLLSSGASVAEGGRGE